jgi:hypothetical protein
VFGASAEFLMAGTGRSPVDPTKYAPPVSEIAERYLADRRRDGDAKVTDQTLNQEKPSSSCSAPPSRTEVSRR